MLSRWFKQNAISTVVVGAIFGIGIAVGATGSILFGGSWFCELLNRNDAVF